VNVDDGAEKTPRAALSVDMQHAQDLQEPNAAVTHDKQARSHPPTLPLTRILAHSMFAHTFPAKQFLQRGMQSIIDLQTLSNQTKPNSFATNKQNET